MEKQGGRKQPPTPDTEDKTNNEDVLDTSALISWSIEKLDGKFVVPAQLDELSRIAPEREIILAAANLQQREAGEVARAKATEIAKESGDLAGLSMTDLAIFSLAIELGARLVSDDYRLQNLAERAGLEWISVHTQGIEAQWDWILQCRGCRKIHPQPEGTTRGKASYGICPDCGTELKLVRKR